MTTVPNADLAKMHITNYATRNKCLLVHALGLRYETTPEQIEWFLGMLRERLAAHDMIEVVPGMPRVRLIGFGASSIDIEARAYVLTGDYGEFLAVQEDLLLMISRLVEEAGTGFAFPSQTTYIARDDTPDPSRLPRRPAPAEQTDHAPHDLTAQEAPSDEDDGGEQNR